MMMRKRGQQMMGMSFGMIFAIFLIAVFFVIAFIAINSFLDYGRGSKIGFFYEDFQEEVKDAWASQSRNTFFEVDLLLGLNYFINDDYPKAEKHFKRLNNISRYNLFPDDFLSNILLSWVKASEYNEDASFEFFNRIPDDFRSLKQIQNIFLQCYFNIPEAYEAYNNLINDKDSNFFRYNFFLANYLLFNNKNIEAKKIIKIARQKYNSNLLILQTDDFFLNEQ